MAAVHSHYGLTIRETVEQNKHPGALWKRSVCLLNSGKDTTDRHTNIWLIKTVCNQVKCKTEFAKATDEQVALMALRWSLFFFLCLSTWWSCRLCCPRLTTGVIYGGREPPDARRSHRGRGDLDSRRKQGKTPHSHTGCTAPCTANQYRVIGYEKVMETQETHECFRILKVGACHSGFKWR